MCFDKYAITFSIMKLYRLYLWCIDIQHVGMSLSVGQTRCLQVLHLYRLKQLSVLPLGDKESIILYIVHLKEYKHNRITDLIICNSFLAIKGSTIASILITAKLL